MPVFKIEVTLSNNKSMSEYRDVPGVDLDSYYLEMQAKVREKWPGQVAQFSVVQVSDHHHISQYMRSVGLDRIVQKRDKNE